MKKFNFKNGASIGDLYEEYGVVAVFILEMVLFSMISPVFFSAKNILNVLRQIAITGILSTGMTFVIITGGIDLSVGAIIALVTVLTAGTLNATGSILLALLVGLLSGTAIGLLNGLGVAFGKMPPFIMTLGATSIASGLAFIYSQGLPIMIKGPFLKLGNGSFGAVPYPVIYFAVILAVGYFLLKNTIFGRHVYAIGSNQEATRLTGVNIKTNKMMVYVISGFLAGVAGIIYTSQLGIGTAIAGSGYELNAIAAVIVGGASVNGGSGSLMGTFLGAVIIGALGNIMNLTSVNPFIQTFLTGIIIILAVLVRKKK